MLFEHYSFPIFQALVIISWCMLPTAAKETSDEMCAGEALNYLVGDPYELL